MNVSLPVIFKSSEFQRSSKYDIAHGLSTAQSIAARIKNSTLIVRMFRSAGYPLGVALAALANARHESDLSNYAVGDSGESVGLFQLYSRGAGAGMSLEERMNPRKNTKRIIQETDQFGGALMEAYRSGASVAQLTVLFGRDIERPKDKGVGRDATAHRLYGALADVPAKSLVLVAAVVPIVVGVTLGIVALGIVAYSLSKKKGG